MGVKNLSPDHGQRRSGNLLQYTTFLAPVKFFCANSYMLAKEAAAAGLGRLQDCAQARNITGGNGLAQVL
jgi:hypothetical protein